MTHLINTYEIVKCKQKKQISNESREFEAKDQTLKLFWVDSLYEILNVLVGSKLKMTRSLSYASNSCGYRRCWL